MPLAECAIVFSTVVRKPRPTARGAPTRRAACRTGPMDVLIVDDHALFRHGLEMLLTKLAPRIRIQHAADVHDALELQSAGLDFDLLLMQWQLPGLSRVAALQALRKSFAKARILILAVDHEAQVLRACLDQGASGFLPKDSTTDQLTQALTALSQGRMYLPPAVRQLLDGASASTVAAHELASIAVAFPALTQRQCEVFLLMARGLTNKLIARELSISVDTVKQHLSLIYQVLGVHSRTEALYIIAKRGIRVR